MYAINNHKGTNKNKFPEIRLYIYFVNGTYIYIYIYIYMCVCVCV